MSNYQNMKKIFVSTYGVRGGTKIYLKWLDWRRWTADIGPQESIRVTGKRWATVVTSPVEFRVEVNS